MTLNYNILKMLRESKNEIRMGIESLAMLIGTGCSWFILAPYAYTYANSYYPILRYIPIITIIIIIVWSIKTTFRNDKAWKNARRNTIHE